MKPSISDADRSRPSISDADRSSRPSFVLVHGAWHDARAWDQLRLVLDRQGRRPIAVDLPIEDTTVTASGYARAIATAARELSAEPPVIVGHSMAGIAIALVPALGNELRWSERGKPAEECGKVRISDVLHGRMFGRQRD